MYNYMHIYEACFHWITCQILLNVMVFMYIVAHLMCLMIIICVYIFQIYRDSQPSVQQNTANTHIYQHGFTIKKRAYEIFKSWGEERMSLNMITEKLFETALFVVIFIVDNSYISEGKNLVICLYLVLGTEIFTPTSMINIVIIFISSVILKSS